MEQQIHHHLRIISIVPFSPIVTFIVVRTLIAIVMLETFSISSTHFFNKNPREIIFNSTNKINRQMHRTNDGASCK